MYQVVYKKRATKMLARMSPVDRRRMLDALGELARDPAAAKLDTKRLQARNGFRLRVGDWRVLYELESERLIIQVLQIGPRGDIYK